MVSQIPHLYFAIVACSQKDIFSLGIDLYAWHQSIMAFICYYRLWFCSRLLSQIKNFHKTIVLTCNYQVIWVIHCSNNFIVQEYRLLYWFFLNIKNFQLVILSTCNYSFRLNPKQTLYSICAFQRGHWIHCCNTSLLPFISLFYQFVFTVVPLWRITVPKIDFSSILSSWSYCF